MRISLKEIYMEQHFDKQPSLRNIFYQNRAIYKY